MRRFILAIGAGLALAPASAFATRCDGDFELVHGSWISTPYCRAVTIAEAARERGERVSPETLLRHPARAEEVCRFVKSDPYVHPACETLHPLLDLSF